MFGEAPRRRLGSIVAAVIAAVVVAAFGPVIGWIWAEVAPRVAVIKAEQGFLYAEPTPEQAMAGDGWFAVIGAAAGLVFGLLAWIALRRYRGVAVLVGLTLGSLAAAGLAWWVGYKIGVAQFDAVRDTAAMGARLEAPLGLRVTGLDPDELWPPRPTGVAAIQALISAAIYTAFAGFSIHPDLRGEPRAGHPQGYPPGGYPPPGQVPPGPVPPGSVPPGQVPQGPVPPGSVQPGPVAWHPTTGDQFGPGLTGNSDNATGTART